MSRKPKLNFEAASVLLVGLPVLGLAGVLKAGRGLSAPASVDGTWRVEAEAAQATELPCLGRSFLENTSFSITQSGRDLVLNINRGSKVTASGFGLSSSHTIKISALPTQVLSADTGCSNVHPINLDATVDAKSEPRSLLGTMTVDGCSACGAVTFHAIRQSRSI